MAAPPYVSLKLVTTDAGFINSGDSRLIISSDAPTVGLGGPSQTIDVPSGSLSATGYVPNVSSGSILISSGSLSFTTYPVFINPVDSPAITPSLGSISFSSSAPTLAFDTPPQPGMVTVTLAGQPTYRRTGLQFESDPPTTQEAHRPSVTTLQGPLFAGYQPQVLTQGGGNLTVAPDTRNLGISSDAPSVHWNANITGVSLAFASSAPITDVTNPVTPPVDVVRFASDPPSTAFSTHAPTVVIGPGAEPGTVVRNLDAEEDTKNRHNICDISGIKCKPGVLIRQRDGLWVHPDYYSPRNIQDFVKSRPEKKRQGALRPEPVGDETFLTANEVSSEDL